MRAVSGLLVTVSLLLLVWTYMLYPLFIRWLGGRARSDTTREAAARPADTFPRVAVIVAAHEEAAHIGQRVRNLLGQDYPAERLNILIGSDGSRDETAAVARAAGSGSTRVQVVQFPIRRGKASVLNDLCALTDAELLVFSDANTEFATDTLTHLATPFGDPLVGAVCGELDLRPAEGAGNQDGAYWKFERRLKAAEAALGGLLGANGAVYAIRRALYRPLEPDMICDDLAIGMEVSAQGWKSLYRPEARAYEQAPSDESSEFHRRTRIGIGNYQILFRRPEYLFRGPWVLRFTYISHKVLRWMTPLLLSMFLAGCAGIRGIWPFGLLVKLQLGGYALAALIYASRRVLPWPAPFRAGMLFVLLNVAFGVAFVRYVRGDYRGSWRRTVRV